MCYYEDTLKGGASVFFFLSESSSSLTAVSKRWKASAVARLGSGEVGFPAGRWSEKRRRRRAGLPVPSSAKGVGGAMRSGGTLGLFVGTLMYKDVICTAFTECSPPPPPSFCIWKNEALLVNLNTEHQRRKKLKNSECQIRLSYLKADPFLVFVTLPP